MNNKWISVTKQQPIEGIVVITKIEDDKGIRNEGKLKRKGGLWFIPDGSMYVYYAPTHWKPIDAKEYEAYINNKEKQ